MKKKKREFAVMIVERYYQTVTKIVQAETEDEAYAIAETLKNRPDPKKLELEETEISVLG